MHNSAYPARMSASSKNNHRELSRLRWSFTSQKKKDKLLQDARQMLRLLPETAALLDLADTKNIDIRFNDDFIGTIDSGVTVTDRNTGHVHIELKPYAAPEDIVPALIHELRHVWQNDRLGLTPKTMALGEKDADTALLLMRVKEADAFAYTDIAIKRLNNAAASFAHSEKLRAQMLAENNGQPLTERQEDQISDVIAYHIQSRLESDKKEAGEKFLEALTWLDGYDRETLSAYHRRYTTPEWEPLKHLTEKDGHVIKLADIRNLTEMGLGPTRFTYLDHLDDVEFENAILRDVAPALLETSAFMTAFEKSAAPEKRQEIHDRLNKALQTRRPML